MRNLVSVGGSPSSGTTLVADLLDSVPGFICPPELYVLCCEEAYEFGAAFKSEALKNKTEFFSRAPYSERFHWFNRKYIHQLGLTGAQISDALNQSCNAQEFFDKLGALLEGVRQKSIRVFCEKTPINVTWADRFCEVFRDGAFIHVVREPIATISSLVRRGYGLFEATIIYLRQTHVGFAAEQRLNYIRIRYEDVLADPFGSAAKLAVFIGQPATSQAIEKGYRENAYRFQLPRPSTWTAKTDTVGRPIEPDLSDRDRAFVYNAALTLSDGQRVSTKALCDKLGYKFEEVPIIDHSPHAAQYYRRSSNLVAQAGLSLYPGPTTQRAGADEIMRLRRKLQDAVAEK